MSMRVIAGSARGSRLECPPGEDVRPAPEMARAALFNILQADVPDAHVLDLFAGAGTIGIEALSRGAARAVFIEVNPRHKAFIEKNLQHTHLADRAEVLVRDAFRSPEILERMGAAFDLIYIGPPFPLLQDPTTKAQLMELLDRLAERGILKPEGVLVVQSDSTDHLPEATAHLRQDDLRRYGRNVLTFYRRAEPPVATATAENIQKSACC